MSLPSFQRVLLKLPELSHLRPKHKVRTGIPNINPSESPEYAASFILPDYIFSQDGGRIVTNDSDSSIGSEAETRSVKGVKELLAFTFSFNRFSAFVSRLCGRAKPRVVQRASPAGALGLSS